MAAATLGDLQTFITTYIGPIVDMAMLIADQGAHGAGESPPIVPADDARNTPLTELVKRIAAARAAGALPAAYTGGRATTPRTLGQNWTNLLASWNAGIGSAVYTWPSW